MATPYAFFISRKGEPARALAAVAEEALSTIDIELRAWWVPEQGPITPRIVDDIRDAMMVLADLRGNATENVCYELGIAHAFERPAILFAVRSAQLPFDLRDLSYIAVKTNEEEEITGGEKLRQDILRFAKDAKPLSAVITSNLARERAKGAEVVREPWLELALTGVAPPLHGVPITVGTTVVHLKHGVGEIVGIA
ncbi:MAG TPA: hypothetical protein VNP92_22625, partial [Actinophytocola sp.]|nr:hypothetical protein [Actinophytocola sp.]